MADFKNLSTRLIDSWNQGAMNVEDLTLITACLDFTMKCFDNSLHREYFIKAYGTDNAKAITELKEKHEATNPEGGD